MRKINDRIILGVTAGLVGMIPKMVLDELSYLKGIEKSSFGDIISGIYMPKRAATSKKGRLFGFVGDMVVGAMFGIPLVYLLTFTGKDRHLIKGGLAGLLGIGFFRGLVANIGPGQLYPRDPATNSAMSLTSTIWGMTAAAAALYWGNHRLFSPKSLLETDHNHKERDFAGPINEIVEDINYIH